MKATCCGGPLDGEVLEVNEKAKRIVVPCGEYKPTKKYIDEKIRHGEKPLSSMLGMAIYEREHTTLKFVRQEIEAYENETIVKITR